MKLDLSVKMLDLKGQPLMDGQDPMTLGSIIATATINQLPEEREMKAEEKVKLFKLAQRAVAGGQQDFSLEDAAYVKERIGKMFNPLIVGQVYALLEGDSNAQKTS